MGNNNMFLSHNGLLLKFQLPDCHALYSHPIRFRTANSACMCNTYIQLQRRSGIWVVTIYGKSEKLLITLMISSSQSIKIWLFLLINHCT